MAYLFNTVQEQAEMLQAAGVDSVEQLFEPIPSALRLTRPLNLPPALTELELEAELQHLAVRNANGGLRTCFLGGGAYDHFIPAAVDAIAGRSEFYTAYTPYQAEASQGSLQAFFEYQTLICQLTGMDVSNASLYEGGTAVSEAAFMAMRATRRHEKIVVLGSVHPEFRQILRTYLSHHACEVTEVPTAGGTADLGAVEAALDEQTACLIVQHPNFFGCLEEMQALADCAHRVGALLVQSFDPISLGLLAPPGSFGVDIAVAEGQSLGTPLQYGGPYLGILATKQEYVRQMPGRLIGQTVDRNGSRSFVLNLQAREQHIRREKATSNICTNQGLMALRATVYLALLGPQGLRETADLSCRKAHYAAERLTGSAGIELAFERPFFKEFVVRAERGSAWLMETAARAGFDVGPEISAVARTSGGSGERGCEGVLIAVTEKRTRAQIDALADALGSAR